MNLRILKIISVLVLPLGLFTPALAQPTSSTIGVLAPLTGGLAPIGEALKNGVRLASRHFDPPGKLEFAFEDYAFQPAKAAAIAKKFTEIDKVAALIVFGTGGAEVCAPIAERAKVPMIGIAMNRNYLRGRQYSFDYYVGERSLTDAAGAEVKRRGYRRIAIVTTEQEAMLALRDRFKAAFSSQVISDDTFAPSDRDFQASAARIKSQTPDAIYLLLLAPQSSIFAKQLRTLNYQGALFGSHPMDNAGDIRAAQGALDDAWLVSTSIKGTAKFRQDYRASYGIAPEHTAPFGYDIAKILIDAFQRQQPITQYLSELKDVTGVLGTSRLVAERAWEAPVEVVTAREVLAVSPLPSEKTF